MKVSNLIFYIFLFVIITLSSISCTKTKANESEQLHNSEMTPEEKKIKKKVDSLLSIMTLQEKIGQLNLLIPGGGFKTGEVVSDNVGAKIKKGQVGGLFGIASPDKIRKVQDKAMQFSRLKIPLLFGADVIHGYKTTFPIPLGMAASWDLKMIEKAAKIAAKEATADGINWNFSPMVDIAKDPRWGRIAEGAGEDPYLGGEIAKAYVYGYQGEDISSPETMIACVKHFALYGAAEAGRDYNTVDMSRVRMYNEYFPPYKAAIDAGVVSAMSSFNDVDGIPATGNRWLLHEVLRNQWGFKGFVVSDYTSINEMIAHGVGDLQTVSAQALHAGLDMDMVGEGFLTTLEKSLKEKKITEQEITQACRRILVAKYKLGLFDDPYRYINKKRVKKDILIPEHRAFAREIAAHSFVLLKNYNSMLPLSPNKKIALTGPLADSRANMLGMWAPTGDVKHAVTVREGFKNMKSKQKVMYARGANIVDDAAYAEKVNYFGKQINIDKKSPSQLTKEAVDIAEKSEIVVAVIGEASDMSGESSNRSNIDIPSNQLDLIKKLVKTGKPVVVVLMSGRPLVIGELLDLPVSILQAWHPGVEAGNAIVDVLYGKYNPSGKLTSSWPRNVGQIPIYYSRKITGRPNGGDKFKKFKSNYLDVPNSPLFPFGYGLSYTNFAYSNLKIDKTAIKVLDKLNISIDVENTGNYDGEEIIQLYIRDIVRTITPPEKELKGFKKIFFKKGEKKTIQFVLTVEELKFYNSDLKFVSEPGDFEVFVGSSSQKNMKKKFALK